jgi:hypothetical protein
MVASPVSGSSSSAPGCDAALPLGAYDAASSICRAAVHAGVLTDAGGEFSVAAVAPVSNTSCASLSHGARCCRIKQKLEKKSGDIRLADFLQIFHDHDFFFCFCRFVYDFFDTGVQSVESVSLPAAKYQLRFAPTVFVATCADTALTLLGPLPSAGTSFRVTCPAQCALTSTMVTYGCSRTNAFSAQSTLCRTALHAGAYRNSIGGTFDVTIIASQSASYCASAAGSLFASNSIATDLPPVTMQHPYAFAFNSLVIPLVATCTSTFGSVFTENKLTAPTSAAYSGSNSLRYSVQCPVVSCGYSSASAAPKILGCLSANLFDTSSILCASATHSFIDTSSAFQMVGVPAAGSSFCAGTFNSMVATGSSNPADANSVAIAWRFPDAPTVMSAQSQLFSSDNSATSPPVGDQVRAYCPPKVAWANAAVIGCWLQNKYSAESNACLVAMHGGVISLSDGGVFRASVVAAPTYFCGASSNQVPAAISTTVAASQLTFALQIPARMSGSYAHLSCEYAHALIYVLFACLSTRDPICNSHASLSVNLHR